MRERAGRSIVFDLDWGFLISHRDIDRLEIFRGIDPYPFIDGLVMGDAQFVALIAVVQDFRVFFKPLFLLIGKPLVAINRLFVRLRLLLIILLTCLVSGGLSHHLPSALTALIAAM